MELGVRMVASVNEVSKPTDGKKMKFFFRFIVFCFLDSNETIMLNSMFPTTLIEDKTNLSLFPFTCKRKLENIPISSNNNKQLSVSIPDKFYSLLY